MSGQSNVGNSHAYESGDQRNVARSVIKQKEKEQRFHEGKEKSHKAHDSKDERSIANKLAREGKRHNEPDRNSEETEQTKRDPTLPAVMHGNEPSKGAKLDAEIRRDEEAELKKKGKT